MFGKLKSTRQCCQKIEKPTALPTPILNFTNTKSHLLEDVDPYYIDEEAEDLDRLQEVLYVPIQKSKNIASNQTKSKLKEVITGTTGHLNQVSYKNTSHNENKRNQSPVRSHISVIEDPKENNTKEKLRENRLKWLNDNYLKRIQESAPVDETDDCSVPVSQLEFNPNCTTELFLDSDSDFESGKIRRLLTESEVTLIFEKVLKKPDQLPSKMIGGMVTIEPHIRRNSQTRDEKHANLKTNKPASNKPIIKFNKPVTNVQIKEEKYKPRTNVDRKVELRPIVTSLDRKPEIKPQRKSEYSPNRAAGYNRSGLKPNIKGKESVNKQPERRLEKKVEVKQEKPHVRFSRQLETKQTEVKSIPKPQNITGFQNTTDRSPARKVWKKFDPKQEIKTTQETVQEIIDKGSRLKGLTKPKVNIEKNVQSKPERRVEVKKPENKQDTKPDKYSGFKSDMRDIRSNMKARAVFEKKPVLNSTKIPQKIKELKEKKNFDSEKDYNIELERKSYEFLGEMANEILELKSSDVLRATFKNLLEGNTKTVAKVQKIQQIPLEDITLFEVEEHTHSDSTLEINIDIDAFQLQNDENSKLKVMELNIKNENESVQIPNGQTDISIITTELKDSGFEKKLQMSKNKEEGKAKETTQKRADRSRSLSPRRYSKLIPMTPDELRRSAKELNAKFKDMNESEMNLEYKETSQMKIKTVHQYEVEKKPEMKLDIQSNEYTQVKVESKQQKIKTKEDTSIYDSRSRSRDTSPKRTPVTAEELRKSAKELDEKLKEINREHKGKVQQSQLPEKPEMKLNIQSPEHAQVQPASKEQKLDIGESVLVYDSRSRSRGASPIRNFKVVTPEELRKSARKLDEKLKEINDKRTAINLEHKGNSEQKAMQKKTVQESQAAKKSPEHSQVQTDLKQQNKQVYDSRSRSASPKRNLQMVTPEELRKSATELNAKLKDIHDKKPEMNVESTKNSQQKNEAQPVLQEMAGHHSKGPEIKLDDELEKHSQAQTDSKGEKLGIAGNKPVYDRKSRSREASPKRNLKMMTPVTPEELRKSAKELDAKLKEITDKKLAMNVEYKQNTQKKTQVWEFVQKSEVEEKHLEIQTKSREASPKRASKIPRIHSEVHENVRIQEEIDNVEVLLDKKSTYYERVQASQTTLETSNLVASKSKHTIESVDVNEPQTHNEREQNQKEVKIEKKPKENTQVPEQSNLGILQKPPIMEIVIPRMKKPWTKAVRRPKFIKLHNKLTVNPEMKTIKNIKIPESRGPEIEVILKEKSYPVSDNPDMNQFLESKEDFLNKTSPEYQTNGTLSLPSVL